MVWVWEQTCFPEYSSVFQGRGQQGLSAPSVHCLHSKPASPCLHLFFFLPSPFLATLWLPEAAFANVQPGPGLCSQKVLMEYRFVHWSHFCSRNLLILTLFTPEPVLLLEIQADVSLLKSPSCAVCLKGVGGETSWYLVLDGKMRRKVEQSKKPAPGREPLMLVNQQGVKWGSWILSFWVITEPPTVAQVTIPYLEAAEKWRRF